MFQNNAYSTQLLNKESPEWDAFHNESFIINPFAQRGVEYRRVLIRFNTSRRLLLKIFIETDNESFLLDSCFQQCLYNEQILPFCVASTFTFFVSIQGKFKLFHSTIMPDTFICYPTPFSQS